MANEQQSTISPTDDQRRCRLNLCRAADDMVLAVREMSAEEQMKAELVNAIRAALRMALVMNDGHMSQVELRAW